MTVMAQGRGLQPHSPPTAHSLVSDCLELRMKNEGHSWRWYVCLMEGRRLALE